MRGALKLIATFILQNVGALIIISIAISIYNRKIYIPDTENILVVAAILATILFMKIFRDANRSQTG